MSDCPRCQRPLLPVKTSVGISYGCRTCGGRAVGLPVLRRMIPSQYVEGLWRKISQGDGTPGQACPSCRRPMHEVPVPLDGQSVALDICGGCQLVWFDPSELQRFPKPPPQDPRGPLPEKVREAMAMADLRRLETESRGNDFGENSPDEVWKTVPALLGLPVETDVNPVRCWPWVTWGLVAAMALVYALTFAHLQVAVDQFGLVPARWWRAGGLTFPISFFLHGGLLHLAGNVYFLWVFGDNVEDHLGPWRYGLLLAAAALTGDLLHVLADPRAMTPCVGASGGISGVLVFYALQFPNARLGFMFNYWFVFRWVHVPAWFALIAWLLLQMLVAHRQLAGMSDVSALAHLGGAGVGLIAWVFWRRVADRPDDEENAWARLPQV